VATWRWTVALLANPVTGIVVGIIVLGAALAYLYFAFDSPAEAWNAFYDLMVAGVAYLIVGVQAFGQAIADALYSAFVYVTTKWDEMVKYISDKWDEIANYFKTHSWTQIFTDLKNWLFNLNPLDALFGQIDKLQQKWDNLHFSNPFAGISSSLGGFGFDVSQKMDVINGVKTSPTVSVPSAVKPPPTTVKGGGLMKQFNNSTQNNSQSKTVHTGPITVNNYKQNMSASDFTNAFRTAVG
jgi:hypothetical protein